MPNFTVDSNVGKAIFENILSKTGILAGDSCTSDEQSVNFAFHGINLHFARG